MQEIKASERYMILDNYQTFDERDICYWYNKIDNRLLFLTPLLLELDKKGVRLHEVSESLNQEYFEISSLFELLNALKKENL